MGFPNQRYRPGGSRKWWRWLIPALVVVVAAAVVVPIALTGGQTDQRAPAGSVGAGLPTVIVATGTRTPRPEGRDMQAVTVALRALDPCLLGPVELAAIPTGPHSCLFLADPDFSPGDEGLTVKVGADSTHISRYLQAPVTIGGAKAYQYVRSGDTCQVVIPVSANRSVELESPGACPPVRRYAEATVAKLRAPDSVAMDPASRPFAAWDGCVLVTQLLGGEAERFRYKPTGTRDPFAGCYTAPLEGDGYGPRLEISYAGAPEFTGRTRQVAGRTVEVADLGKRCIATWDNGPSGSRNTWFAATVVKLSTQDCDTTARLVARVVALAGQRPADADAAPQRPLLYGPDDNDTATRGACVDFSVGASDDCEPYQEVGVPEGPAEILAAAEENRHVQCAVFDEAIEAAFGAEYAAVTWGAHCIFVAPDHVLQITVNVDAVNVPGEYGRGGLYRDRRETTIAGKPMVTFWGSGFDVYLSPGGDLAERGNLHIGLSPMGGRGVADRQTDAAVTPKQAGGAVEAMAQVVRTHFA
ncbi:MAG: hypothetical protein GEV28_06265 [Actinophytocola sp.]|uniref:hypothetical protein n=1 Tax=Actinophytocola sp. TaxID=1872138 RepID=UPI001322DA3E|nr:hypothetical protein [Actinophytocola sp.]MPZ80011.1 hypothetical protein [Actinophytocola sp.]